MGPIENIPGKFNNMNCYQKHILENISSYSLFGENLLENIKCEDLWRIVSNKKLSISYRHDVLQELAKRNQI